MIGGFSLTSAGCTVSIQTIMLRRQNSSPPTRTRAAISGRIAACVILCDLVAGSSVPVDLQFSMPQRAQTAFCDLSCADLDLAALRASRLAEVQTAANFRHDCYASSGSPSPL